MRTQYAPKPISAGTRVNSTHGVPAIEPTMIATTIAMSQSVEVLSRRDSDEPAAPGCARPTRAR